MAPLAQVFGVRHFSPAGAVHLEQFLDRVQPRVVLIEGPSDATGLMKHLAHRKTRPPVAVLAFTKTRPVRSLLYPMATYSPEWVALRWALEHRREVRFMDLPASVFLARRDSREDGAPGGGEGAQPGRPAGVPPEGEAPDCAAPDPAAAGHAPAGPPKETPRDETQAYLDDPWEAIAAISGDPDHETWWERHFEHNGEIGAYRDAILELGRGLREVETRRPDEQETLLREAFMRRELLAAAADPDRVVAVCGAFHAPVLTGEFPAMTDAELAALPRADCVVTLMPYSHPRLSSQSGYGAGNHAPAYFEALYQAMTAGEPQRLRAQYFAALAASLRRGGNVRSSAEVIEAVRLAEALASMNGSSAPVLRDLRDAAVTLLGQGERLPLEGALQAVEIGTTVGALPEGVSKTALQDDFHQLVKGLKLEKFIEDKEQRHEIDLRENRFVQARSAAFLGRAQSTFLHRLAALQVGFGALQKRDQAGTAKERWKLRWTPECEIRLAESSLGADSIEVGAALALTRDLAEATDVGAATGVLLRAADCELADALTFALRRVQDLTVDEAGFASAAIGIENLAELIRYGNVREVDPAPLAPVLAQLYLRATLLLFDSCVCADDAAAAIRQGLDRIQNVAFLGLADIDPEKWIPELRRVAESDDRNPFLSGYAAALLIERGRMSDSDIDREVGRRLSPGTEAGVGVAWFEGLVQRNRAALFLRRALWACLVAYVDELGEEGFRRALLYLRRAFSTFSPGEIRRVVSLLAGIWQGGADALARAVERKLDAKEIDQAADDLAGLDLQ